jgi:recombinational DNA repair protein RecT
VLNVYSTKMKDGQGGERRVNVVQYMPMSYGLIQKIYEAGASYVDGVAVYEKDEFRFERGDAPRIVHNPYLGSENPGPVVAAYVVVKLKSGEIKREVMPRRDIEKVRLKSKQPDGLMWGDFYDQGAIKSVIHRINKQLPRSDVLERALGHDNEVVGLAEVVAVAPPDGGLDRIIDGVAVEVSKDEPRAEERQAPKKGDVGTPEMKAAYLETFSSSDDLEVLGLKMDEARFYSWPKGDLDELEKSYRKRLDELKRK